MPEPKAQLVDPQGPIDVPGLSVTGVTTATCLLYTSPSPRD